MRLEPVPVALPLLCAAVLAGLGEKLPRAVADALALFAALATTAASVVLLFQGPTSYWFGGFRPRQGVALGIDFAVDAAGAGLAALSGLLIFCALIFSLRYFDKPQAMFQALMLAFLAGLCGLSLTGDLFDLFVFFELMGAAAFGLCAYKSREAGPLQGAINFAVTNTAGAFLTLAGIALLYGRSGALNLAQVAAGISGRRDGLVLAGFALVCCGFLVKSAAVPFHFWLADAHGAAPTPACIVFSGAMVEAGLYAVARLYGTLFAAPLAGREAILRAALLAAGAAGCILGAALCFAQRQIKRLLAYSTISHAGAMLVGIGLLDAPGYAGAIVYSAGHGLVKGALFLCAGMLLHRLHSVDEISLHGRGGDLPWLGALFLLGGILLAGSPPGALFLGEDLIEHAAHGHLAARIALRCASIVTAAAVLRAGGRIFLGWGPRKPDAPGGGEPDEEPETEPAPIPWTMWSPAVLLLAAAVGLGLAPGLADGAQRTAARMIDPAANVARILHVELPREAAVAPASPPSFGSALESTLAAVGLALLTLFRGRLPAAVRRPIFAVWSRAILALRALHTGEVGDQVAWLTFGVALLGALSWLLR